MTKETYIEKIIQSEWMAFDQVKNKDGRASCQDDWDTFSIMRKSQYLVWPLSLLESYYQDISYAEQTGRNLIMEKYARMMESTAPQEYKELEAQLPPLSEECKRMINEMVSIQTAWMEEFAVRYPRLASQARVIHSSEDSLYRTSYETYLRGELSTYSEHTLLAYGRFIVERFQKGGNLAEEIMEQTVRLYGYHTLEEAEHSYLQN